MLLAYVAGMLLITRLGRNVLMDGDCVSNTYTVLLCLIWFAASLAGSYVCAGLAPFAPYGPILFPALLATACGLLIYRNLQQLPGQQSTSATSGVTVMIMAGTIGALYLRHAL